MKARRFRKCAVCGTHGHPKGVCPVRALNAQQEAATRSDSNILLGLTPALEREIALIRANWRLKANVLYA